MSVLYGCSAVAFRLHAHCHRPWMLRYECMRTLQYRSLFHCFRVVCNSTHSPLTCAHTHTRALALTVHKLISTKNRTHLCALYASCCDVVVVLFLNRVSYEVFSRFYDFWNISYSFFSFAGLFFFSFLFILLLACIVRAAQIYPYHTRPIDLCRCLG